MKYAAVLAQILWMNEAPKNEDSALYLILGIIAIVVIAILIRAGMTGRLSGGSRLVRSSSFSRGAFRRAARAAGLAEEEVRFLEEYGRSLSLSNPDFVFRNQAKLDGFFKDVYRHIEKNSDSETNAEALKATLFAARERLTHRNALGSPVSSTRQLGRGMPLSFIAPGEESYPSAIVAVEPGGIAVEPVLDPYNEPIRFHRGTKLACYFYTKGHQGYQFGSRVVGWERIGSKEVMVLSHSDALAALPARRHARREMQVPCTYYRVSVAIKKLRGKDQSAARVENTPFPGTIVDISAGGLGIQSANALAAGEFIKIEFDSDGGSQAAFCKVIRMNRLRTVGGIMHLQFVKISRRTLNAILSYVYGYSE